MDRRGFGESQGLRGDIRDEETMVDDHFQFYESVAYLRGYHPNTPKFLIGHSLGALYAARLCQREKDFFKGLIMINPLLDFKTKISYFTKAKLTAQTSM